MQMVVERGPAGPGMTVRYRFSEDGVGDLGRPGRRTLEPGPSFPAGMAER